MRDRKEIESYLPEGWALEKLIIELLLDIRDLLASPAIQKDFGKTRDLLTKNQHG